MLDDITQQAFHVMQTAPGACPSAEHLAAYLEGRAGTTARSTVEEHLLACDSCLQQVSVVSSMAAPQSRALSEARLVDVVVTFLGHAVEILNGTREILILAPSFPVPVRAPRRIRPNVARFARSFDGLRVDVTVERLGPDSGEIGICAFRGESAAEGLRFSLLRGGRELVSYPAENGCVLFEPVPFGRYVVSVRQGHLPLGEISLALKEE